MKDFCSEFSEYLVNQKSVSANTLESYVRDVEHFIDYLSKIGKEDPVLADTNTIYSYIEYMKRSKKSDATITRNIASIRCFYQYMVMIGYVDTNPAKAVRLEKTEKKFPQILSGKEIELLLSQPDVREPKGCRDKAMLELLYATGIRVSELVDLDISDISLQTGMLRCNSCKHERVVPVYPTAINAITDYIVRGSYQNYNPGWRTSPFCKFKRKASNSAGILEDCKRICRTCEDCQRNYASYVTSFFCFASFGKWCRIKRYSGDARPCRYFFHADVRSFTK
jgi:site-specific recombinase XerD